MFKKVITVVLLIVTRI